MYLLFSVLVVLFALLSGCTTNIRNDPSLWTIDRSHLPPANMTARIDGLGPCTDNPDRRLHLNTNKPTIIMVHGCYASAGRFRALSEVFAFHGQQTACFTYNDRDSLMTSSAQLMSAIHQLARRMKNRRFTLIGHSQGGLISRKAVVEERKQSLAKDNIDLHLVTISTPFSGIAAAAHCGSTLARILSFGLIVPVCYAISGDKWYEITNASEFIRRPGELIPQVDNFLKIDTDENNTCRRFDDDGQCLESDDIFSLAEQYYPAVDNDQRVTNVQVRAGHAEIVGSRHVAPVKLIKILQAYGVMNPTAAQEQTRLHTLLSHLYDLPAVFPLSSAQ